MDREKLFEAFPPVPTEKWMEKIIADLKGADFNRKMMWRTREGFEVKPFYRSEDTEDIGYTDSLPGDFPYIRGISKSGNNWLIRQNISVSDYSAANRKALDILMRGVDSLGFIIEDPESVNYENFKTLLSDIHPEVTEINFLSNGKAIEILDIFSRIIQDKGADPAKVRGAVEADPLGRLLVNGTLCVPPETGFDYLARLTASSKNLPLFRTIHLNASNLSNAGAGIVQELGYGLSMGSEYMAQLTSRGIDAAFAASSIRFSFGTGSDYFLEIAKLRAARLLWSAVIKGFIPDTAGETKMKIHCVTSAWNKTLFDPHVNMLRTQTEAMSAVLGGTDSLTVEPFDIVFRRPDDFSERIARNQQLLLREEAYFGKVADPAAGSYYIENLTRLIAEKAWRLFVDTWEKGGFLEALKSGSVQSDIEASARERIREVATGKKIFVGTNQFPDGSQHLPQSTDLSAAFGKKVTGADLLIDPVVLTRGSEEFERIRIDVLNSGKLPVVFLLTIGNLSMRRARAQFSAGFFGSAGYKIIDNPGFSSAGEGTDAFLESGADIAVICSSDDEYLTYTPEIVNRLKGNGIIVIAGNPASSGELKELGIGLFIHMKSDVAEMLRLFNGLLGINK